MKRIIFTNNKKIVDFFIQKAYNKYRAEMPRCKSIVKSCAGDGTG